MDNNKGNGKPQGSGKRNGNFSSEQKEFLLDCMQRHPELKTGKFTKTFTFAQSNKLWSEVAIQLNQMRGGKKDYKKWRKTWLDLRSKAKKKSSQGPQEMEKFVKKI